MTDYKKCPQIIRYTTPFRTHSEEATTRYRHVAQVGQNEYATDVVTHDKGESEWMRHSIDGIWRLTKRNDEPWTECVPRESPPCRMCIPMYECESSPCEWRMIGNSMQTRGTGDAYD